MKRICLQPAICAYPLLHRVFRISRACQVRFAIRMHQNAIGPWRNFENWSGMPFGLSKLMNVVHWVSRNFVRRLEIYLARVGRVKRLLLRLHRVVWIRKLHPGTRRRLLRTKSRFLAWTHHYSTRPSLLRSSAQLLSLAAPHLNHFSIPIKVRGRQHLALDPTNSRNLDLFLQTIPSRYKPSEPSRVLI